MSQFSEEPEGYDHTYDCYYDPITGEWLEEKCSYPDCRYCKDRPPKHHEPITKESK